MSTRTDTLITVCGNIASDPQVKTLDDGAVLCSFRLACTSRRWDRASGQYVDGATAWFGVTAWRFLGANCGESLKKGERVIVQGSVRTRDWTDDDGRKGTSLDIDATAVGHDLTWGRSTFTRVVRVTEVDLPGRAEADALARAVELDVDRELLQERAGL